MLLILTIFEECQKVNSHELNLKLIRNRVLNFSLYQKEKKLFIIFLIFPAFQKNSEKLIEPIHNSTFITFSRRFK